MTKMEVTIDNPKQLLSHVLLGDRGLATSIAQSDKWKSEGLIEATLCFNGKEVSAQVLEDALQYFVKNIEERVKENYNVENIDSLVEERAKQVLKEYADNALDKLLDLTNKLQDCDNLIKPHWER